MTVEPKIKTLAKNGGVKMFKPILKILLATVGPALISAAIAIIDLQK